ncbi:MAG TPA: hypothetical protein VMB51_01495 [Solirubrobacteraceae bacterium]|nr:hypothetical protein [Solirubrobacteraceae bacterium]
MTASNNEGSATAPSLPSADIAPGIPPSNTSAPSISGGTAAGQPLTASTGTWEGTEPISYTYQWQRCNEQGEECANIAEATGETYTSSDEDIGSTVQVVVTASNTAGSASATSAQTSVIVPATPPSNTAPPTISGVDQAGQTLTASTGSWHGTEPRYSYQWESCSPSGEECAPIEYATSPEYELGNGDIGTTLRVQVTASNDAGSAQATSTATTKIEGEPATELEAPSISGTPDVHNVLSADYGQWTGTERELSYQWESCSPSGQECAAIAGATEAEYDLTEGDEGSTLRVRIGLRSLSGSITDVSPATALIDSDDALADTSPPRLEGTPQVGETLTTSSGRWTESSGLSYTYQWQRCDRLGHNCKDIESATGRTYEPTEADSGSTLRALVTARNDNESASQTSPVTQPIAPAEGPVEVQRPVITGTPLEGQTLTVENGSWSGEGEISYAYQWERCDSEGDCTTIEHATASSYTLASADVNSTVVAIVTASDTEGSAYGFPASTPAIEPEALTQFSQPSIAGVVQVGATLEAEPGIWSGAGAISYTYQWERCNAEGDECIRIESASEQSYTVVSGDLGATLRVKVTVTGPDGSKTAFSPETVGTPGGEVTVQEAQQVAEQTDPSLLAPSSEAMLEEQTIAPVLADGEEEISSQSTLTSSTVSKETPGEFAVNTAVGELSLTPSQTSSHATETPTIVNGSAALFANTWPATDTMIRPEALGATAFLQIRSGEAPSSFSWELSLGPDQQLRQLSNGNVAVIKTPYPEEEQSESQEPAAPPESAEGPPETSAEAEEIEHDEARTQEAEDKGETETETPLEPLPEAPTSSAPEAEPTPGQPQPQNTQERYEAAQSAMSEAEGQTKGQALMVIQAPKVTDASGNEVPATLSVSGDTITLAVKPSAGATFPLIPAMSVAAPTNQVSEERDPVERYGLADDTPEAFSPFDHNLETGPMHVKTARLVIPYDVLFEKVKQREIQAQHERVKDKKAPGITEYERLTKWLTAVRGDKLEPFITIGPDFGCNKHEAHHRECEVPGKERYREAVHELMDYGRGRGVKLWGAWNEPESSRDPLHSAPQLAGQYWQIARYVAKYHCSGCAVVAGEFALENTPFDKQMYDLSEYRKQVRKKHTCDHCWPHPPTVWGFHDYHDVVHRTNEYAELFAHFTVSRQKSQLWITEAAVELQDGTKATEIAEEAVGEEPAKELQTQAAYDFYDLYKASSRITREYYFDYRQPSEQEREEKNNPHLFDGGLVEAEPKGLGLGSEGKERPAYCVLAFQSNKCEEAIK